MNNHPHLLPEVAQMLQGPDDERIEFCREDRWVSYPAANAALERLDDLLNYPRAVRMPNLLIVAGSGNGKTSILQSFVLRNPSIVKESGDLVSPTALVEVPPHPTVSSLCSSILWKLSIVHREKDPAAVKMRRVLSILKYVQLRMLILDEFDNIAEAGQAREILSMIRHLSKELKLVIGAAGTGASVNALNQDPQLKSRFQPLPLPSWPLERQYLQFLAAYEKLLPLAEPSGLATAALAPKLHAMCGEAIGETVKVMKAAAAHAIKSGTERITPNVLDDLGWVALAK